MQKPSKVWSRVDRIALVTIGLLGACGDQTGPAQQPVLIRALSVEVARPGAAPVIRYRVENLSTRPVFILACGEQLVAELEQRGARAFDWARADAALRCPANLLYLPVELGAQSIGEGTITAPNPGTYRLRVAYRINQPSGRSEAAVSGPIRVPQP